MDGHEPDHGGAVEGDRPLTRRELRARAATGVQTPVAWALPDAADPDVSDVRPPSPVDAARAADAAGTPDAADAAGTPEAADAAGTEAGSDSWDDAVGWAVRHELPATLPPEPETDVDDVRWEAVLPDQGSGRSARVRVNGLHAGPRRGGRPADTSVGDARDAAVAEPQADGGADRAHGDGPAGTEFPKADPAVADPVDEAERGDHQPRRVSVLGSGGHATFSPVWQPSAIDLDAPVEPDAVTPSAPDLSDTPLFHGDRDFREDRDRVGLHAASTGGVSPVAAPGTTGLPTLDDLLATRRSAPAGPAEWGWRGMLRRLTGGIVALPPDAAEQEDRELVAGVQRGLDGPRTVVVINPKGGAHKTTAALMIAATFGRHRGGYTLAWDNNETRGTLGWRSLQSHHHRTAVDLLDALERFADPDSSRVGDLDNYVRSQASAQFDVLASDEDAASAASIDAFAFRALHRTLTRFYRLLVVDTGNNMRASNWQAAIEAADQVVIVSTMREDTAQSAAWALDALRATGHADVVRKAVTVLSQPGPRRDAELANRLHDHFSRLTRVVLEVPYEPSLVAGGPIDHDVLSDQTRRAWLRITAAVAEGL